MAIPCGDPQKLAAFIELTYAGVEKDSPSMLQTKYKFKSGFIVNIFTNGTVNFQGKPDNEIKLQIENQIEIIHQN